MITIFYQAANAIINDIDEDLLTTIPAEDLLWVDLVNATNEQQAKVEEALDISLQSRQQAEEIESSSRYSETERLVVANSNFMLHRGSEYISEPTTFIIRDKTLITQRNEEMRSFGDTMRKLAYNPKAYPTGIHIFIALFETRIDLEADMLEGLARDISALSRRINTARDSRLDGELLFAINEMQETTMRIREVVVDKQRVLSGALKSPRFEALGATLSIMLADTRSLVSHADFSFDRLDFLRDTFMGLSNLHLSRITKTFTVVSVIFMPPTLIASLYGMNFALMPELQWRLGYPFAILLMVASSVITLIIFRIKKLL